MARLSRIAASVSLVLLAGSLISGQVIRVPLPGQGGGLLVSDVAVGAVLGIAYAFCVLRLLPIPLVAKRLFLLITLFLVWAAFGLSMSALNLPYAAALIGLAYCVRLAAYLLLLPALVILFQDKVLRRYTGYGVVGTTVVLVLAGLLQLLLLPQLKELPQWLTGWDPHSGRLVGTWLDPNFMGLGVLLLGVMTLSIVRRPWLRAVAAALCITAILLTGSRSSLAALGVVALISSLLVARRWAPYLAVGFVVVGILGWLLLGSRAVSLFGADPTVALRLESLQAAWRIIEQHPWLGVGYNVYQFNTGATSFAVHSRAGTDNSLLLLWATTGIAGVMLFLLPWAYSFQLAWQQWLRNRSYAAAAGMGMLAAVALHAQFINSWLYGHILILLAVGIALALKEPHAA